MLKEKFFSFRSFFKKDFLIKLKNFFLAALKQFDKQHVFLHVTSLTYYTILAIVPVIAMGFAIAKGFDMDNYLFELLEKQRNTNKEFWEKIIEFAHTLLDRTKGGIIAGIGMIVLLWTIFNTLSNIEKTFNAILGVQKDRKWNRKITDYLTIIFIAPILILISVSISIFIQSKIEHISEANVYAERLGEVAIFFLRFAPFFITCLVITLVYLIIPNTTMKIKPALYGGVFAGVIFQLFQNFYIYYQVKLTSYNAVYGSFAAIPFFIIWVYYSWCIILLGVCFINQFNHSKHHFIKNEIDDNHIYQKKLYYVFILHEVINNFKKKYNTLLSVQNIADKIELPLSEAEKLLNHLQQHHLIHFVIKNDITYVQLAFDVNHYSLFSVLNEIDHLNKPVTPKLLSNNIEYAKLKKRIDEYYTFTNKHKANTPIC